MLRRRVFAFELLTYISDESMPEPGRSGTDLRPVAEGRRDIDCSAPLRDVGGWVETASGYLTRLPKRRDLERGNTRKDRLSWEDKMSGKAKSAPLLSSISQSCE